MHSYHNVAELRQFRGVSAGEFSPSTGSIAPEGPASAAAAIDLNIEVPDLLAQRVAVKPEQVGGADLVAARGRQRRGKQRHLDLFQDAVIEPRRRHAVGKAREVRGQVG